MPQPLLSPSQTAILRRLVADGFTDTQIVRQIEGYVRRDERDDDDNLWPLITRQAVAYHRKKFDDEGYDDPGGELLLGTIVGTRDTILRRYAKQMGDIELLINNIADEMRELEALGALIGGRLAFDEEAGVIEGSVISVDGEPMPQQIVIRSNSARAPRPEVLHPDLDPLFQRYVQLGHLHVKQVQQWQRIVQDVARVAGLGFPPNLAAPVPQLGQNSQRASLAKIFGLDG
jgi:hypothetical protein